MPAAYDGDETYELLHAAALSAAQRAYAPYSNLRVGAAGKAQDRVVTGCNVENASYGLTLCAECVLVGQLQLTGGGTLEKVVVVDGDGNLLAPCGRCRQLLHEHGAQALEVAGKGRWTAIEELLPGAFEKDSLPEAAQT